MKVLVKFTAHIRVLTGADQIVVDLDESSCLSDLLGALIERYGDGLNDLLYASELSPIDTWATVVIDGQAMRLTSKSDIKLKEGSTVVLLAPVSGG
jgi:molybdopterin converting factor small subunit